MKTWWSSIWWWWCDTFGATLTRPRSGSSLRGLESIYHNILPLILTFILMSSCCVDRQGIYYLPLGRSRDAHLNVLFRCSAHWNWYGYWVGEPNGKIREVKYEGGIRRCTCVRKDSIEMIRWWEYSYEGKVVCWWETDIYHNLNEMMISRWESRE